MGAALRRWSGVVCLGVGIACGGEGPPAPGAGSGAVPAASESAANEAPRIERVRLDPAEPLPGGRVRAVAQARDPDGDRVTQAFLWEVAGLERDESGAEIELPEVEKGAEIRVRVTASDGRAESEPAFASATVANRRPVLENVALQPSGSVQAGHPAVATPLAEDPDGDPLEFRYRWTVNDAEVEGREEASLPTEGLRPGDQIRVQVVASDGEGESDAAWSGVLLVGNAAPEIVSAPSGVGAGQAFRYVVDARDPEGDKSLRYQLRKGPDGMSINPILGELSWRPRADQAGVHPVEVSVEDSQGARTVQVFQLTVGEAAATPPPAAPGE